MNSISRCVFHDAHLVVFLPLSGSAELSSPPEVVVGHVKVFQCEQEVVKGLSRDFDQLVVVDDQVLQVDQSGQVPGAHCCQSIT